MTDKKKSIGIITFHRAHNYGAVLQVFALQNVLMEKYDVQIIDYRNEGIEKIYKVFKMNKGNILTRIKSMISSIIFYRKNKKRYKNFEKFINEKFNLTMEYDSEEKLQKESPKLDVYITGSDQVWSYELSAEKIDAYTLNFGNKSTKKIAYAASTGRQNFNKEHEEEYKTRIEKLDAISIREEDAKKYLETIINKNIEVVLDPTLLMKKDKWEELFDLENREQEKYIFAYMLTKDDEYYKTVNYLSEKTGLKVINVSKRNKGLKNILRNDYLKGPIEFLRLIKNAEYVIATSFHAAVFSILFNKKFWIVLPKDRGVRITNLLSKLNIDNRAFSSFEEFKNKNYSEEIDYTMVNERLEKEREKSLVWLYNSIEE